MKYTRKTIQVEAFLAGVDETPEWFKNNPRVALIKDKVLFAKLTMWNGREIDYLRDHYIIKTIGGPHQWDKDQFEKTFEPGDIYGVDLDDLSSTICFGNAIECYNSLHEDLRDLRKAVKNNEEIASILLQIAITALQAKKDLCDETNL